MEKSNKKQDLLSKFTDGEKKYLESALFNRVIDTLLYGEDPLIIIDNLILQIEDYQKTLKDCIEKSTHPKILV